MTIPIGKTPDDAEVALDLPKLLAARLLIQADSGGGKSRMLRLLAERLMSAGRQVIVIDPEGEFGTLREAHDLLIVGGDSGDVPLTVGMAAPLARMLAETRASCVIDLEPLDPVQRHQFVRDLLEAQIRLPRDLWGECYVLLDEAPMFAPERGRGDACSTAAVIASATRGRKRGVCLIPATQRFSMLHKDVAALCSNVLIGPTTPSDTTRAAELAGVEARNRSQFTKLNARKREWIGRGPAFGTTETLKFTADAHETTHPQPGEAVKVTKASARVSDLVPKLAKVADELRRKADADKAAETNLKQKGGEVATAAELAERDLAIAEYVERIDELEAAIEEVRNEAFDAGQESMAQRCGVAVSEFKDRLMTCVTEVAFVMPEIEHNHGVSGQGAGSTTGKSGRRVTTAQIGASRVSASTSSATPASRAPSSARVSSNGNGSCKLGKGEAKILTAIAQHRGGVDREQLTVLTGYKRSSRDTYLQRLNAADLIDTGGSAITATQAGVDALGSDFRPLPTGSRLRAFWLEKLSGGEAAILEMVIGKYPAAVDRDAISEETGYKRSSRDTYIQRLSSRKLITTSRDGVTASDTLFDRGGH